MILQFLLSHISRYRCRLNYGLFLIPIVPEIILVDLFISLLELNNLVFFCLIFKELAFSSLNEKRNY